MFTYEYPNNKGQIESTHEHRFTQTHISHFLKNDRCRCRCIAQTCADLSEYVQRMSPREGSRAAVEMRESCCWSSEQSPAKAARNAATAAERGSEEEKERMNEKEKKRNEREKENKLERKRELKRRDKGRIV